MDISDRILPVSFAGSVSCRLILTQLSLALRHELATFRPSVLLRIGAVVLQAPPVNPYSSARISILGSWLSPFFCSRSIRGSLRFADNWEDFCFMALEEERPDPENSCENKIEVSTPSS